MNQQDTRAAVIIAVAVVALGAGALAMQFRPSDDTSSVADEPLVTELRTPINVASLGPQVGEQVPSFSLPDQNGQVRTLESVLGPNGALLLFYRSADW